MTATIRIEENGPVRVEGEFDLIGSDGTKISEGTWMKIALCRCGQSSKKPFCDGSHRGAEKQSRAQETEMSQR